MTPRSNAPSVTSAGEERRRMVDRERSPRESQDESGGRTRPPTPDRRTPNESVPKQRKIEEPKVTMTETQLDHLYATAHGRETKARQAVAGETAEAVATVIVEASAEGQKEIERIQQEARRISEEKIKKY